jgi:hypothetical protein
MVDGVLQDYRTTQLHPCSLPVLARLLPKVRRYGLHGGPNAGVDLLTHSVHVARVAERLAQHASLSGPNRAMIGLYARLHDIGKLFGGDVNALVPAEVLAPFRAWQANARTAMQIQMNLPAPPAWAKPILKLADRLVVPSEIVSFGGMSPASVSLEGALEECETINGLRSTLQGQLDSLPDLAEHTLVELVRETHGLTPGGDLAHAFCAIGPVYLTAYAHTAVYAWKSGEETRRALQESEELGAFVVALGPLRTGAPADRYTREAFLRGFPTREVA